MAANDSTPPTDRQDQRGCRKLLRLGGSKLPPPKIGKQFRLRDGRRLGYAEFGDPTGKPLFFFHGLPGSRLFRHPDAGIPASLGVRLITVDRPGIGLSDFKPNRQLTDWPDDIMELANGLQLDQFAVAGVSAGGPYSMACAFAIPQRLQAVGLISSAAPPEIVDTTAGMSPRMRWSFKVARCSCLPWWSLYPAMALYARTGRTDPEKIWQRMLSASPECDRVLLVQPDVKQVFLESIPETYRQGPRGHIHDALVIARDWGFEIKDITEQVHLWQGTDDTHIPPAMARYLADAIPNCQATYIPDEGHLMMFRSNYWRDILSTLASY